LIAAAVTAIIAHPCGVSGDPVSKFDKSRRNHGVELRATGYVLTDPHFQQPRVSVKVEILRQLGLVGDFTHRTFDLVKTAVPAPELTVDNVGDHLEGLLLVEVKSTAKRIEDTRLNGFFFGSTGTQFALAAACPDRYRTAFVVMNPDNRYGRPFFTLLTPHEVESRIRSKRVQFQVNFHGTLAEGDVTADGPYFGLEVDFADDRPQGPNSMS
jgi:hypothetical protein